MCKMLNFVNFIICIATFSQTMDPCLTIKRGPHHPRSEPSRTRKVDQHLTHEEHHIDDDLKDMGINVNLEDMSEEEKNFYYFKVHTYIHMSLSESSILARVCMRIITHPSKHLES
ncbi:PREDICTED: uncharacterized protein LOC108380398 [Rhagoletis zephyria]|uniref:uncharacterized protein LOC108380398 n=1 Tax=Rhagoletis zephyria TaxID=28612 RepID=UPI000811558A|nr:PREDICTED: uncharacterized protein LOC108380398 [Rhagoletis zephyria]